MTARELIEALSLVPPETVVNLRLGGDDYYAQEGQARRVVLVRDRPDDVQRLFIDESDTYFDGESQVLRLEG